MTKKGFFVPVLLQLSALLVTGIPWLVLNDDFLDQSWWPIPLILSSILSVSGVVADIIYAPVPPRYQVHSTHKYMAIGFDCTTTVVLKRMTKEGQWAKVEFVVTESGLVVRDRLNGGFATISKKDNKDNEEDGLVQFPSGNFLITKLTSYNPAHFRVTWSSGAWVEDQDEKS